MRGEALLNVMLDQALVQSLLNGLYQGAQKMVLKVIIDTAGHYHIQSKELKIDVLADQTKTEIEHIHIHNEKQEADITRQQIHEMGFKDLSQKVVKELRDKYSPVRHSLADNIYVFGRTYS